MEHVKIEAASEFNLFDLFAKCQSVGDKRKANDDECKAYARWLAMRAGIVEAVTNSPNLKWKSITRQERICIGAYFGDAFVPFPGADQNGAVTFELLDESGNVETSGTIYAKPNGALNIAAGDVAAMKESGKAWSKANKGKAKAAPIAAPISEAERTANSIALGQEMAAAMNDYRLANPLPPIAEPAPVATLSDELDATERAPETPQDDAPASTLAETSEIAPQDEKNAVADDIEIEPDPIALLMARMDALEAMLASPTPIAVIDTDAPLSGESKPKRTAAHVRAIMAYLAMRKERNAERKHNAMGMQQIDAMRADRDDWHKQAWDNAETIMNERLEVIAQKAKRRRAVKLALKIRASRNRHSDVSHDRFKHLIEVCREREALSDELRTRKAKIADPSNPVRESDLVMLKANAEKWQAKAEAATGDNERLRRLALQNAGHIETLASRVARAEAMLREGAPLPVLTLVPPTASVAA